MIPQLNKLTLLECNVCPSLTIIPVIKGLKKLFCSGCPMLTFAPETMLDQETRKVVTKNYNAWRMKRCKEQLYIFEEELIKRTWHPSRLHDWCYDDDEIAFMDEWIQ
jgi:hypothetical protein